MLKKKLSHKRRQIHTDGGCKIDSKDGSVDGDGSSAGGSSPSKSIVDGVSDDSVE